MTRCGVCGGVVGVVEGCVGVVGVVEGCGGVVGVVGDGVGCAWGVCGAFVGGNKSRHRSLRFIIRIPW